jgi:hypothetical protein
MAVPFLTEEQARNALKCGRAKLESLVNQGIIEQISPPRTTKKYNTKDIINQMIAAN